MSDTQHTPGPWSIGDLAENEGFVSIDASSHGALAEVVVKMDDDPLPSPELIANARLIAASPELLEALTKATDLIDARNSSTDRPSSFIMNLVSEFRAIITKATGAS